MALYLSGHNYMFWSYMRLKLQIYYRRHRNQSIHHIHIRMRILYRLCQLDIDEGLLPKKKTYFVVHWMTHPLVLRVIPGPSPSPSVHVFVRIIIKSVRMLGRRTFGDTTPHASLSRLLMERVTFFERFDGTCGGKVHGEPKAVQTRLWWLGAISGGKLAALKSS